MANPDSANYIKCMEEIKNRIVAIEGILSQSHTTPFVYTNNEFMCLQFRKIFELIVLATLASHFHLFEKLTRRLRKEWRISEIIREVRKRNTGFYPRPIDRNPSTEPGIKDDWVDKNVDFLTLAELIDFHGKIGWAMHAANPYSRDDKWEDLQKVFPEWLLKIYNLLNNHLVEFPEQEQILYVGMKSAETGKVHSAFFIKNPL